MSCLLRTYPQFDESYILHDLPLMRGWAYYASAMESNGWLNFVGVRRSSKGYVAMEIDKLMNECRDQNNS